MHFLLLVKVKEAEMLKIYLRQLLEEYLEEIDLINAISLVRMDVDDLLDEIEQELELETTLCSPELLIWYLVADSR